MKAYDATFTKNGSAPILILVGASSLKAAASKAQECLDTEAFKMADLKGAELVKVELTDKVIL